MTTETLDTEAQESQANEDVDSQVQQQDTGTSADESQSQQQDWRMRRLGEIAAKRREAEARAQEEQRRREAAEMELAQLRASMNSQGENGQQAPVHPNVQEMARIMAEQMVQQRTSDNDFMQRVNAVETAGRKEFGNQYDMAIQNLQYAGLDNRDFVNVLTNVPNAEKLVVYLGQQDNVEEAMRIASLNPVQMGIELTKLSAKAARELGKQVSKAPAPMSEVEGGSSASDGAIPDPKKDPKAWIEWRNKNARRR